MKADNGFSRLWRGSVWCNLPYGDPAPWVEKAIESIENDQAECVLMLLPNNRLHTNYIQNALDHSASSGFVLCRGKQHFIQDGDSAPSAAPFRTVLLLFGTISNELLRACDSLVTVVQGGSVESTSSQSTW